MLAMNCLGVYAIYYVVGRFYIALFSAFEQTHCVHMWFWTSDYFLTVRFWIAKEMVYFQRWCHVKLLSSRRVLCTPHNYAPSHVTFMQSHIHRVHACLAVTCPLLCWQNERDLLRAVSITRGWNGYRNKSQHRKLTLEKKIPPRLLPTCRRSGTFC